MAQDTMSPLAKARGKLLIKHIFYATLVLSTPFEIDNSIPTAATDMRKIVYNEKFINSLPTDVVMFVIVHEVMHIMLKHGLRRGFRKHGLWNIACDHAINLILTKGGFAVWDKAYCDKRFEGMGAEEIYDILNDEQEKRGGGSGGDQPCDGGFGQGDLQEPNLTDPAEAAKVEQGINQRTAQAASMARMAGKMPSGLDLIVDGLLHKPQPWQDYLREYMTQVRQDDESWSKRNRRFNTFLPSRHSEGMGEIVVIGDTSGSMMMDRVFAQIAVELNEIVEQVKPERVRVIWADDTEVSNEEVFEPGDEIVLHPKGGGGTDMRKPLRYAEKYDPEVVLLITDGYTPWPSDTPYPLVVACTTKIPVPIGAVVRLG